MPLYANLHRLSKVFWPLLISLLLGSLVGIVSSAGVAWVLGLDDDLIKSLLSRSVSTPSLWVLPAKSVARRSWRRCL